ncbi:MAG: 5-bromo-4-chloroindolyl phosphate hydrolysis family protein [Oscillospiraceae bacterium]|jgi:hypothetical protein|nr:5-bromo-4-chloroindolyl phosphate hydrolysis family protein [Oscillospiraceae bacterium]
MKPNKNAKTADIVFGMLVIALSLFVAGVCLLSALFSFVGGLFGNGIGTAGWMVIFGPVFGAAWVFVGIKAILRAERSGRYEKIIGAYPRYKISDILKAAGKPLKSVSADLKTMKKRGYFEGMSFDLENKELVFAPNSEPLPQLEAEADFVYKENRELPVLALVTALITALTFSAGTFDMTAPALVTGACAFFLMMLFFPAPVYFTEVKRKTPAVKKPSATGNEALDGALYAIYESKKEFIRISTVISERKIREPVKELLRLLEEIAAFITENPEKAKNLRQFVGYYLPTTVSFLKTYEELNAKPDKGGNILATLEKIEEVTGKMTDVFKREYDDLFSDKAMGVSAEISVMQSIINEHQNKL